MYQVVGYHRPTSVGEALHLLTTPDRVALGGGVHVQHDGGAAPTEVVDLQAIGLDTIDVDPASARVGAMVRLQALVDDDRLPEVIRRTARAEQPSTLRTLATVGGTIAAAVDDSLLLAALLAHDATVRLATADGERTVSLNDLLGEGRRPGEVIIEIEVQTDGVTAWARTGRTPEDVPIVGVVVRRVTADGGEATTTFGLCGVADTPLRLDSGELGSLRPIDDHRATAAYRTHLVEVLTGRVLEGLS